MIVRLMAYDSSASNRLAAVRTAIGNCLTAQQYSVSGRMKQMAELGSLRKMERELMDEAQAEADGGYMCTLGRQVPPTR